MVDPDVGVVVIMKADCRMFDKALDVELVEGAFIELSVKQIGGQAPIVLGDLDGMVGVMVEAAAT